MSDRIWIALRNTAYICALALGFGIGFAFCAGCTPIQQRVLARTTEALAIGSLACDGGTTRQFLASDSGWIETNPVLGKHPSSVALWLDLGSIAGAAIGLNRIVPNKLAIALNVALLAVEVQSVAINMDVGSSVCGLGHGGPWAPQPMDEVRQK